MRALILLSFLFATLSLFAQESIDGNFAFSNDPAKKYSIYVPSNYDATNPNTLMLGFHPFNTNRWDAQAWRDTLIVFAETNDLLLVCPDGGADGRIDDPIDIAFTTALLDSMAIWYNVDQDEKYIIGFSWGARATYTYGLDNAEEFQGFIPVGAAINGIQEVGSGLQNAENKKFYIVHGSNDSPAVRFTPVRDALINSDACVETNFLAGIGHTIDFPNRNNILSDAYAWVSDPANCITNSTRTPERNSTEISISNPNNSGQELILNHQEGHHLSEVIFTNVNGHSQTIDFESDGRLNSAHLHNGIYFVKAKFTNGKVGLTKVSLFNRN